ncbi:MAG: RNA 2'-phosphotransferase [Planctomycetota bacterium]
MDSSKSLVSTSKFLSLILRHQPEIIGLKLDKEGWLDVSELLNAANAKGKRITLDLLHEVVANNDKRRFALSDDGLRIRANQGHSIASVDLKLVEQTPPERLFHGTVGAFIDGIRADGLRKRSRNHVHLSADEATAKKVASRRGKPVILQVKSVAMYHAGHSFYLSSNGVWLVDSVPRAFLEFPD